MPSLVKFGTIVLERMNTFSLVLLISHWRRAADLSIEQTWIPFVLECIVSRLVEISSVFLKEMKMWNIYRRTHKQGKTWSDHQNISALNVHWKRLNSIYNSGMKICLIRYHEWIPSYITIFYLKNILTTCRNCLNKF